MSDEVYGYDFEAMARAHDDIRAAARDFERTHHEIDQLLERLRIVWSEGEAATATHAYQAEWLVIFADVVTELGRLGDVVEQARQNASSVEEANLARWA